MSRATNVVALFKDEDRYIFLFDDENPSALLKVFGEFAANKELNFSWYDAAVLSQKVRRLQREREAAASCENAPTGSRFDHFDHSGD